MKKLFQKTKMFAEAKAQSEGHNFFAEIVIFFLVFLVISIVESIPSIVAGIVGMMSDQHMIEVVDQFNKGIITYEEYTKEVTAFETQGSFMLISLFSTAICTILTIVFCRFIEKRRLSTMGFRKNTALPEYLVGAVIGSVMFSLAVGLCLLTGALEFEGAVNNIEWGVIGLFFVGYLIQGMSEEVMFRGYFFVSLSRRSHIALAVFLSSLAFGCAHLGNPGVTALAVINITLFGAFEAFYIMKRGNLWGVCAIHSLWNFIQGNFYGISVSGLGETDSIFRMKMVEEKSLINGGDFGLEGGLAVTVVLVVCIAAIMLTKTKASEVYDEENAPIVLPAIDGE